MSITDKYTHRLNKVNWEKWSKKERNVKIRNQWKENAAAEYKFLWGQEKKVKMKVFVVKIKTVEFSLSKQSVLFS